MKIQNILKILICLWVAGFTSIPTYGKADFKTCERFCEKCSTNAQQCTSGFCPLCLSECPSWQGHCVPEPSTQTITPVVAQSITPPPVQPSAMTTCLAACNAKNCSGCFNPICTALGSAITSNPGYIACSALSACTAACVGAPSSTVCPTCISTCQSKGITSGTAGAPAGLASCATYEASAASCAAACVNTPNSTSVAPSDPSWLQCPGCTTICQKANIIPNSPNAPVSLGICADNVQICRQGCSGASTDLTGVNCMKCLDNAACQSTGATASVVNGIPTTNFSAVNGAGVTGNLNLCNTLFNNIAACAPNIQNAGGNYNACVSAIGSAPCIAWGLTTSNIASLVSDFSWLQSCATVLAGGSTCQANCQAAYNSNSPSQCLSNCLDSPACGAVGVTQANASTSTIASVKSCANLLQTQQTTCTNACISANSAGNASSCATCLSNTCQGIISGVSGTFDNGSISSSTTSGGPGYQYCANWYKGCSTIANNSFPSVDSSLPSSTVSQMLGYCGGPSSNGAYAQDNNYPLGACNYYCTTEFSSSYNYADIYNCAYYCQNFNNVYGAFSQGATPSFTNGNLASKYLASGKVVATMQSAGLAGATGNSTVASPTASQCQAGYTQLLALGLGFTSSNVYGVLPPQCQTLYQPPQITCSNACSNAAPASNDVTNCSTCLSGTCQQYVSGASGYNSCSAWYNGCSQIANNSFPALSSNPSASTISTMLGYCGGVNSNGSYAQDNNYQLGACNYYCTTEFSSTYNYTDIYNCAYYCQNFNNAYGAFSQGATPSFTNGNLASKYLASGKVVATMQSAGLAGATGNSTIASPTASQCQTGYAQLMGLGLGISSTEAYGILPSQCLTLSQAQQNSCTSACANGSNGGSASNCGTCLSGACQQYVAGSAGYSSCAAWYNGCSQIANNSFPALSSNPSASTISTMLGYCGGISSNGQYAMDPYYPLGACNYYCQSQFPDSTCTYYCQNFNNQYPAFSSGSGAGGYVSRYFTLV